MADNRLRIHQFLPSSRANGPGSRAVVWVQGCTLACPGCFNPDTHNFSSGWLAEPTDLAQQIIALQDSIEGVTISGGEPFQQSKPLSILLNHIREHSALSIIVFTGYRRSELKVIPFTSEALNCIDVIIAGRFIQQKRIAKSLMGSTNKEIAFLTHRYRHQDLIDTPTSEVLINIDGEIQFTGIDPISWQNQNSSPEF